MVWLMRHGEAEKAPGQSEDDLFSVAADPPLSSRGVEQAQRARDALARERFDAVFASPARAAIETARIVGGREPTIEKRFAEWPIEGADYASRLHAFMDLPRRARLGPLHPRERTAFSEAMKEIANHHACSLVVSHGLANRGLLCKARGIPLTEMMNIAQEHAMPMRCEWRAGAWHA